VLDQATSRTTVQRAVRGSLAPTIGSGRLALTEDTSEDWDVLPLHKVLKFLCGESENFKVALREMAAESGPSPLLKESDPTSNVVRNAVRTAFSIDNRLEWHPRSRVAPRRPYLAHSLVLRRDYARQPSGARKPQKERRLVLLVSGVWQQAFLRGALDASGGGEDTYDTIDVCMRPMCGDNRA
jgi:hypothetical protein